MAPWAWLLAVLLPIAALLSLLQPKPPVYFVPSLLLWGEESDRLPRAASAGRFKIDPRLLLQLAAMTAAVAALARPYMETDRLAARRVVLIVDVSASMAARDIEPNRLEEAKRRALKRLKSAPTNALTALVAAGPTPVLAQGFTQDRNAIEEALKRLQPTDAHADLDAALRFAESLSQQTDAHIELFTDQNGEREADFQNIALVGVRARRIGEGRYRVDAEALNLSAETTRATLHLTQDGAPVDARAVEIKPMGSVHVSFTGGAADDSEAALSVRLDNGGDLDRDDDAYAVLPKKTELRILTVGDENPFRDAVFALSEDAVLERVSPEAYLPSGDYALVVFDGSTPDALPNGSVLAVNPEGDLPFAERIGDLGYVSDARHDPSERLTRFADWGGLTARSAGAYRLSPQARPLVWTEEAPLIALFESPRRRVVLAAFDAFNLTETDFAMTPAAVVFASNLVEWAREGARPVPLSAEAGEPLPLPMLSAASLEIERVDTGERAPLERPARINAAGIYRVYADGEPQGLIAVNVPRSEMEPTKSGEAHAMESKAVAASDHQKREYWQWFALLAAAFLAAEWAAYERRRGV